MKIRYLTSLASVHRSDRPGDVRTVDGAEAKNLIAAGFAEPAADAADQGLDLNTLKTRTLRVIAKDRGIANADKLKKDELVASLQGADSKAE